MAIIGTFNGASIVSCPDSSCLQSVEFSMTDAVALVTSPFTGQTQTQQWPGADSWSGTLTTTPLTQEQADTWIAFLAQCRGMANCFFIGDPTKATPIGCIDSRSNPVVSVHAIAGTTQVQINGLQPNTFRLLVPGDYIQLGNRLHRVLDAVNSDVSGNATLDLWPSLREPSTVGQTVIVKNPRGLFRLASNKRGWSTDFTYLTHISIPIVEYR